MLLHWSLSSFSLHFHFKVCFYCSHLVWGIVSLSPFLCVLNANQFIFFDILLLSLRVVLGINVAVTIAVDVVTAYWSLCHCTIYHGEMYISISSVWYTRGRHRCLTQTPDRESQKSRDSSVLRIQEIKNTPSQWILRFIYLYASLYLRVHATISPFVSASFCDDTTCYASVFFSGRLWIFVCAFFECSFSAIIFYDWWLKWSNVIQ